jgi:hypothetical protein
VYQQEIDERFLVAETRQQCDVYVSGEAWLAPLLHGEASDEAKVPTLPFQQRLQLCRLEH